MNHFTRITGRFPFKGTCGAIDRQEAAKCAYYVRGKDGWCEHTLRDMLVETSRPGNHAYLPPIVEKRTLKGRVTGECYCDVARAEYDKWRASL